MDTQNRRHSDGTYWLMRAEYLAVLVISVALAFLHLGEIHWGRFIAAFVVIDLLGYVPGALAYHRGGGGAVAPVYHYLYNFTHSYLTWLPLLALWAWALGGPEWAMLAVPIHLAGDRGLFGNVFKPVELPFEPAGAKSA